MTIQEKIRGFEYICIIPLFILFTTLSVTVAVSFVIYMVVYLVSCFFPNYGQFINSTDVLVDEDLVHSVPQNTIVVSLALKGTISLDELRSVFTDNVLKAQSKSNPHKLLYPKLKQYLTTFICFRIWKNDPAFQIKNHIVEKFWNGADPAKIHEECLNRPYQNYRSPWELVLIRNVNFDGNSGSQPTSVLVLRVHHVMGDAISLLKLIVEDLGNNRVTTAKAQYIPENRWDKMQFILWFPTNFILEIFRLVRLMYRSLEHPWRIKDWMAKSNFHKNKTVVAFSPKISVSKLKHVAKQNNVRTSAVVISMITGAIRKHCAENWDKEVTVGFPLPIPNHPEGLTNHVTGSVLRLPTDQQCEFKRLQQCNQELGRIKDKQTWRYTIFTGLFAGLQIYPINRMFVNLISPIAITNNVGQIGDFSLGNTECVDYHGTVGTMRGAIGVLFCTLSFKDEMRVAVIAKESVVSKRIAQMLANHIEHEFQLLL